MSGFTQLDKMIGRLDLLIDMPGECVGEVAKVVEAELSKTLAAGEAPDGTRWAPRKEDGKRALKDARSKVRVGAVGNVVIVRMTDRPTVLHHFGNGRGRVQRQVIPIDSVPPRMEAAINKVIAKVGRKHGFGHG